jgi:peptidoglycan hydrolase-like protein with peptidoglycan-binding domain
MAAKKPVPYMVKSLVTFRDQVNALAPKRSRASDGWIGDVKHQARHSDHNPEPDGSVDAFDLTNDPTNGCDTQRVADALVASKDKRISYIICNGRIVSGRNGPKPWTWRKYTGSNGHYHHMHLSVLDDHQDDTTPWKIESAFKSVAKPNVPVLTKKEVESVLKKGSKGEFVRELQENLLRLGYDLGPDGADGYFGQHTENAVKAFQASHHLDKVDGWAGPKTMAAIGKALETKKLQPKVDQAQAKVNIAKEVVDEAAGSGKVSLTEWLSGAVGAGGAMSVVKQVADSVTETSQSVGNLLTTLGPWILLGVVIVGGAAYIIWDRRTRRLKAMNIKQVL